MGKTIKKTYNCKLITPLFMGGANQNRSELRGASFKGSFRFWWRAGNWDGHSLESLKTNEEQIWGGISSQRKSAIRLRLVPGNRMQAKTFDLGDLEKRYQITYGEREINVDVLKYLSLGMFEMGPNPNHTYFPPGATFDLQFSYPDRVAEDLAKTLEIFSLCGNLGAKSRNGFGSIFIGNNNVGDNATHLPTKDDIIRKFKEIARTAPDTLPPYTAISKKMRLFMLEEPQASWEDALSQLGYAYLQSRSTVEKLHTYSKRKYIAYPLNVSDSETGNSTLNHIIPSDGRRAKPYFFKVIHCSNKTGDEKFLPYIVYLPSKYIAGIEHSSYSITPNHGTENDNFSRACNVLNSKLEENGFSDVSL